ncbi:uncharacterized protein CcaverHIS019_0312430 [Cutaneotrichosporon cavernicola]|uniref:Amino acid permease/ SLC12A domain-containing protein n=1 Tax=Cutaneotrichosporon cavernicola TaxID=279322 RepID=A0AA48QVC3_9TREE|nr:uncharacterized protein CcaverHIS019_0312430 [Cutaneotrichosporon cavernicola]BEI91173.1 hypothetical protein CcaverHIS019_0312430 [Cutaneotrichosporon cavernicola]
MSEKDVEVASKSDCFAQVEEVPGHHTGLEGTLRDESDDTGVVRALKSRHIQLIGIGSAVGIGLFIGSARSLIYAGPLGSLLGYTLFGFILWGVCLCAGEMAAFMPIRGGHLAWAHMYLDPAASFAIGWNYIYACLMFGCADIIAVCGLMEYWLPDVNVAAWIVMTLAIVTVLNVFHVKFFGESEFYFASLKVLLIIGLLMMTFIVMLGGNPKHDRIGFRYWKNPGLFAEYHSKGAMGRFLGFFQVFKIAAFSMGGPDTMAMCAAEAVQPRKVLPRAVKAIVFRLAVFFVLGAVAIGVLVPYNDPFLIESVETGVGANASAYVVGMKRLGIKVLPHIFNAVCVTSAASCTNGFVYLSMRILQSMALRGEAPKFFAKTNKHGVPLNCFYFVFAVLCLSFMQLSNNGATVFGWFIDLSSVATMINYAAMDILGIRFHAGLKKQGFNSKTFLPWRTRYTVPWAYCSVFFLVIITLFQGWEVFTKGGWDLRSFFTCYFGLAFFAICFIFWKIRYKTKAVRLEDMDFTSRLQEFDDLDAYYKENPPVSTSLWNKFLDKIF